MRRHVLVDEMQDTNRPQFELLKLLTPTEVRAAQPAGSATGS